MILQNQSNLFDFLTYITRSSTIIKRLSILKDCKILELVVWEMFIKFAMFKIYEQKQNSEQVWSEKIVGKEKNGRSQLKPHPFYIAYHRI